MNYSIPLWSENVKLPGSIRCDAPQGVRCNPKVVEGLAKYRPCDSLGRQRAHHQVGLRIVHQGPRNNLRLHGFVPFHLQPPECRSHRSHDVVAGTGSDHCCQQLLSHQTRLRLLRLAHSVGSGTNQLFRWRSGLGRRGLILRRRRLRPRAKAKPRRRARPGIRLLTPRGPSPLLTGCLRRAERGRSVSGAGVPTRSPPPFCQFPLAGILAG
mmetsp:Transcript_78956/g.205251  ORF Transcript_78956/g.205251 Transcript_78956/m.205251 type:complete len:211 (-) Transcript_78956:33-665(-)